jgi:hypothetical protein
VVHLEGALLIAFRAAALDERLDLRVLLAAARARGSHPLDVDGEVHPREEGPAFAREVLGAACLAQHERPLHERELALEDAVVLGAEGRATALVAGSIDHRYLSP